MKAGNQEAANSVRRASSTTSNQFRARMRAPQPVIVTIRDNLRRCILGLSYVPLIPLLRGGGSSYDTLLAKSVRGEALVSGLVDQGLAVHRNWDRGLEILKAYIPLR